MTIYVDKFEIVTRENGVKRSKKSRKKKEEKLEKLKEMADVVEDLGVDYIIIGERKAYIIERKSIGDLISSTIHSSAKSENRLFDQVRRIIEVAQEVGEKESVQAVPILLVEGDFNAYNKMRKKFGGKWTSKKIYWGIITAVLEFGVHVMFTDDFIDTMNLLEYLNERAGKPKRISGLNIKKSLRNKKEEAVHMIYAVSRVGEKKAQKLLEKYGTVKNIVNLSKEELQKELGPKTGEHFYEVVNTNFSPYKKFEE